MKLLLILHYSAPLVAADRCCHIAARPLLRQCAPGSLGQKSINWQPPEGLLLDEEGNSVPLVQVAPSDLAAAALAVGLASAELLSHHTSFTLNNMVRSNYCVRC
jgi:hypothetical protein